MGNWRFTLNLEKEWKRADQGEISIEALAECVADKIRELPNLDPYVTPEEIADGFKGVVETEEFDSAMEDLYDWADDNRVWVAV